MRVALGSLSAPRVAVRVVEEALPVVSRLDLRLRGRGGDAEQIIERRARVRAVAPGISPRFWAQARSRVWGTPGAATISSNSRDHLRSRRAAILRESGGQCKMNWPMGDVRFSQPVGPVANRRVKEEGGRGGGACVLRGRAPGR